MLEICGKVLVVLDERDLMECVFADGEEKAAHRMASQIGGRVVTMDVFAESDQE